jgi:hypothetical protein
MPPSLLHTLKMIRMSRSALSGCLSFLGRLLRSL